LQLGTPSLLFQYTLTLPNRVLSTLRLLLIAGGALLLVLLPITPAPVVVPITIATVSGATFSITFPLLATCGVLLLLLLKPAALVPVTVCLLLLSLLLPTLLTFLRLPDLFLPLLI